MFVREIKFVFQISYSLEHLRMAASIVFSSFQDISVSTISKKKKIVYWGNRLSNMEYIFLRDFLLETKVNPLVPDVH